MRIHVIRNPFFYFYSDLVTLMLAHGEEKFYFSYPKSEEWKHMRRDHDLSIYHVEEVTEKLLNSFAKSDERQHFMIVVEEKDFTDYSRFLITPRVKIACAKPKMSKEDYLSLYLESFFPLDPQSTPASEPEKKTPATPVAITTQEIQSSTPFSLQSKRFIRYASIAGAGFFLSLFFRR